MGGELNLEGLLKNMKPLLHKGKFVFCTTSEDKFRDLQIKPLFVFRESEGVTLVLSTQDAERLKLDGAFPSRLITLSVHSSLDAVGFLAAITARLAERGISVNAVSAYFHDHLFVPADRAREAMAILRDINAS
jgi:uncharacterized protein